MATKRISELPAANALEDTCCVPVVSNGATKKAPISVLRSANSLILHGECSGARGIVTMSEDNAYNIIKAAHDAGKSVELELLYYDEFERLPLVTIGIDYYSFASVIGYYSAPEHKDTAGLNRMLVSVYSDGTSCFVCDNIYDI